MNTAINVWFTIKLVLFSLLVLLVISTLVYVAVYNYRKNRKQ